MANPFAANFSWGNLLLLANVWFFKIFLLIAFWIAVIWRAICWDLDAGYFLLTSYVLYQTFGIVKVGVLMYYSDRPLSDLVTSIVTPFHPIYRGWLCAARLVSVVEEALFRRSFHDNYVPPKVRAATIHW